MSENADWYKFQEEICAYFNSIGAEAKTNQSVQGVRTSHDIDILVKTKFLGEDLTWVIEAKNWKTRVPKEKVLALRTIVDDIGADRGFIVSLSGFQSGAFEAAENSNVKLRTIEELKQLTSELIEDEILKGYKDRARLLNKRYWAHKKSVRKDYGLRPEIGDNRLIFSGAALLGVVQMAILQAEQKEYPINVDTCYEKKSGSDVVNNFQQLRNWLNLNLNLLDYEILQAEYRMMKNGDFNPNVERLNPHAEQDPEAIQRLETMVKNIFEGSDIDPDLISRARLFTL